MGGISRTAVIEGSNGREVFDLIYKDNQREFGENSYNGSFSSSYYAGDYRSLSFADKKYSDKNLKAAEKEIDKILDNLDSRTTVSINLGLVCYEATKYLIKPTGAKLETKYILVNNETGKTYVTYAKTATNAKKVLEDHAKDYDCVRKVYIDPKNKNSSEGNVYVKEVLTKRYKTKPKNIPKGWTIKPVYKFFLVGWCGW